MSILKLPYGLKDVAPKHICDVAKGLACDCVCPICKSPLIARKGVKRVHHFAHHSEATPECKWATESLLHLKAKEILQQERRVWLPAVIAHIGATHHSVSDATWFSFDSVLVEKYFGGIRPDLMVNAGPHELLIEIAVRHFCDEHKIEKIQKRSAFAIEIDLSGIDLYGDPDAVYDGVIETAPRSWLFNPDAKRFIDEETARLAAEQKIPVPSGRSHRLDELTSGYIANPRLKSAVVIAAAEAKLKNPNRWLDTPHTDLGNRTPREAAKTESDHDIGMIDILIEQASRRGS